MKKIFILSASYFLMTSSLVTPHTLEAATQESATTSDEELTRKIQKEIGGGWFFEGYKDINVQVKDGAVTLSGNVKTESDKQKIDREVRNLHGVRKLNSNLKVIEKGNDRDNQREFPQDSYATKTDEQLNHKIRDQISKGWLWDSYKNISINTSAGTVTLEGTVHDTKDQYKLIQEIQKIEGVKAVKSNLKIEDRDSSDNDDDNDD